jgi:hypothetical protein
MTTATAANKTASVLIAHFSALLVNNELSTVH